MSTGVHVEAHEAVNGGGSSDSPLAVGANMQGLTGITIGQGLGVLGSSKLLAEVVLGQLHTITLIHGVELGLVGVLTSKYEVINVPSNIAKEEGWLTCTEAGIITWNNGGTTLLANEVANSHAVAHLDAIGYFGGKGKVTFLATK